MTGKNELEGTGDDARIRCHQESGLFFAEEPAMPEANAISLVSIITPSYNQAQFLEETIRSVIRQEYAPIEYIVIDGGSTDGSIDIIRRYEEHLAFWITEPDRGQVDAINKGLMKARGDVVAWINSDDMYMAGAVREAVQVLQQNPEVGMVYGDGLMVDAQGRLLDRHCYRTYDVLDLLCFDVLLQPTVFMRRNVLEAVGYLSDEYDLILDHELWIRVAAHSPIHHVPSFWAVERTHERAKTIAQADSFSSEAERMIVNLEMDPAIAQVIRCNPRRVEASLHAFAARRFIDAGQHRRAVKRLFQAFFIKPAVVVRYWYKAVQAVLSAMGLERLFLGYRRFRRKFQHAESYVVIGEHGAELNIKKGQKS
jgi:glycosyltransferase involved in cell wall biosynthesis